MTITWAKKRQNLLVFRLPTLFLNPVELKHGDVQITVAEEVGLGSRAGYYDTVMFYEIYPKPPAATVTLTPGTAHDERHSW
jgi:hypothetical protein